MLTRADQAKPLRLRADAILVFFFALFIFLVPIVYGGVFGAVLIGLIGWVLGAPKLLVVGLLAGAFLGLIVSLLWFDAAERREKG